MVDQLTPNVCERLHDRSDYTVLVACPVVKITQVVPSAGNLCGFTFDRTAFVVDADPNSTPVQVIFPAGRDVFVSSGTGGPRQLAHGDLIRLQKMLRLPIGNDDSVILAYDVEMCADDDIPLEVTNYEETIKCLRDQLQASQAALEAMVKPRVGEGLLNTVCELIVGLNSIIEPSSM